jgi:hypothetical protein
MAVEGGSEVSEPINISEARALFEKTTPGEWSTDIIQFLISDGRFTRYQRGEDAEWLAKTHNNHLAMLDELEWLRATVAQQQAELGEYWRAAVAIESVDDAVSAKGLADLHSIRTGNSYSQVGLSVAEMLLNQRDELQKEVERLRDFESAVIAAMQ